MQEKTYNEYEKLICIRFPVDGINLREFKYSHDFIDNVNHITECSHYVGGDTGMSHFVSVLDEPDRKINYYYNGEGLLATTPFYSLSGKGRINMFHGADFTTENL